MTASIPTSPFENLPQGQVTFAQAAAIMGVTKSKLESLVKQHKLPTVLPEEFPFPRRLLLEEVLQHKYPSRFAIHWEFVAAACVQAVRKNHVNFDYGVWYAEKEEVAVMFHNRLREQDTSLRGKELALIRKRLAAEGMKELGFATARAGGHTYAIVIAAPRPQRKFILDVMMELSATLRAMAYPSPDANPEEGSTKE